MSGPFVALSNAITPPPANPGAITTFRWINAGGDGETQVVVVQTGDTLSFFESTNATVAAPISTTRLVSTILLTSFQSGDTDPHDVECQYAAGNGYLFVFHPQCTPFYCYFNEGTVQAFAISVQIRDFLGYYPEPGNPAINYRPTSLTPEHTYNLENQGWTAAPAWTAVYQWPSQTSDPPQYEVGLSTVQIRTGTVNYPVGNVPGLVGITAGSIVSISSSSVAYGFAVGSNPQWQIFNATNTATGSVESYDGTNLLINVESTSTFSSAPYYYGDTYPGGPGGRYYVSPPRFTVTPGVSDNTIATFFAETGVYPSNSDIWYTFKDDTGSFDPASTYGDVGITTTPAPRGHFIYNAFNMTQAETTTLPVTDLSTDARPSTGAWFQGRVWFTGVNGNQQSSIGDGGDQNFYTWSENIYFSQIIQTNDITSFGYCYQTNDPTDENFFDLLPTDGGVITIQGAGNIYKLFPIQNGMLVFAQNGVWFITGSTGIGFSATDYTITKISSVQSISNTSFIDVLGLPFFWNEEGIYRVTPAQQQGLAVEPLTVETILQFYNSIPLDSKKYARGDYDPTGYVLKWIYKTDQETGISDRYQYDGVLNLNIFNKAFYPYTVSNTNPSICSLLYVNFTNSMTAPNPGFRYLTYNSDLLFTFAGETDNTNWTDWFTANGTPGTAYDSHFITGYNLHGKGIYKFQPVYVMMYTRDPGSYLIQSIWDYASSPSTGRYSTNQLITNPLNITYASGIQSPNMADYDYFRNRIKIRGHGEALQLKVSSYTDPITGKSYPFDVIGWTVLESIDAGI